MGSTVRASNSSSLLPDGSALQDLEAIDEMATATAIIVIVCVILTAVIIYATKSKWRKICAGTKVHVYQLKEVTVYGDEMDTTWMNTKALNPHVRLFDNLGVDELQDLNLVDVEDLVE